jgi:hypothetical protein
MRIDVGELLAGRNPIVGIDVDRRLGQGATCSAASSTPRCLGGILRLSAGGQIIPAFDRTTPVADRVFFSRASRAASRSRGVGGFTIRLGLSELGPLTVQLEGSCRRHPARAQHRPRRSTTSSPASEFFKTLPSIDDPFALRGPAFQLPPR